MSFYTGSTMITNGSFKYNANKILNINPNYLTGIETDSDKRNKVWESVYELLDTIPAQFSQRQVHCLEEAASMFNSPSHFTMDELMGIHEIRFEGAGNYRSGTDSNYYNTTKVTEVSVDFTGLSGNHNDGQPSGYNDGYGLYGAMSIVIRKGVIVAIFFRASSLPDKMDQHATLAEGIYSFKVGLHPMSGGSSAYKALNIYKLYDITSSGRTLPAVIDNANGDMYITGVNCHKGYNSERGSEGCQTITYNDTDYDNYINLFSSGEIGKYILVRKCTLPNI